MPMRTLSSGRFLNSLLISSAHNTAASGVVRKTSAPPSPVGNRNSFPSASAARNCIVPRTIFRSVSICSLCWSISSLEYSTMSMNRTFPISNFTSEEDPDSMGFTVVGPDRAFGSADRSAADPTAGRTSDSLHSNRPGLREGGAGRRWRHPYRRSALESVPI